ncbi:hypothetical protein BYT27DRAFT_7194286 [Phlegmacium glaucopus]|nr:hypothetical protein BYT27DRAFT_7194286 [Phlegmacium glaucopus]
MTFSDMIKQCLSPSLGGISTLRASSQFNIWYHVDHLRHFINLDQSLLAGVLRPILHIVNSLYLPRVFKLKFNQIEFLFPVLYPLSSLHGYPSMC